MGKWPASSVLSVAWSPSGQRILSGSSDSTMREWNAADGSLLRIWLTISPTGSALLDLAGNRILHASPNAWRKLGWVGYDEAAERRRVLPAEIFGPLPSW